MLATVSFETPNERRGRATTSLEIVAPTGVDIRPEPAPAGWSLDVSDGHARWTGGRIEGENTISFPLEVLAEAPAGPMTFQAAQGYDDGAIVRWNATLTVLPPSGENAPPQHLRRALVAGTVGLALLAASFLVLRRLRRRTLQER